jgi:hypothetical protein
MGHVSRAIHPDVASADCEELLAAGYGDVDRDRIPSDWRTRPRIEMCHSCQKRPCVENSRQCGYCRAKYEDGQRKRRPKAPSFAQRYRSRIAQPNVT